MKLIGVWFGKVFNYRFYFFNTYGAIQVIYFLFALQKTLWWKWEVKSPAGKKCLQNAYLTKDLYLYKQFLQPNNKKDSN